MMEKRRLAESSILVAVLTVVATVGALIFNPGPEVYAGLCIVAVLHGILCELRLIREALTPRFDVTFHPDAHLTDEEKQSIMRAAFEERRRKSGWTRPKAGGYQPGVFD